MESISKVFKSPIAQIIIAIFIGWFFFYIGQKEAKPSYAVEDYQVFADLQEDVPELKLLWNDKPIDNFYGGRVAIWNAGNNYIDSSRLISSDPIRIVIPSSIELLNFYISDRSRHDLNVTVAKSEFEGSEVLQISLNGQDALEPNEGFAVKMYFTSNKPELISVDGRIKGIPEGFTRLEWKQEFSTKNLHWSIWLLLVFAVLSFIDGLWDSYNAIKNGQKGQIVSYLPRLVFGPLMSFFIVYYVIIPEYFGMVWLT